MDRTLVTEKELLAYLNKELEKTGQQESYFESLVRLRVDDRTGCNWSSANLKSRAEGVASCPPAAERIVEEAKARFNLK